MEEIREGFLHFWEVLTGVLDDDNSKLLRIMSFVMLFLGCLWAGLNYFQAQRIANLDEEITDTSARSPAAQNNRELEKILEAAKVVATMRQGGEAIAQSMSEANTNSFSFEGYNELGIEDLSGVSEFGTASNSGTERQDTREEEEKRQELQIKALMVSKRKKYAVINYAGSQGAVVHQGQKLPGGGGRIVRITQSSITVRDNGKEYEYRVQ